MEATEALCQSFGLPAWIGFLLGAAKGPRSDRARRRKAYRLMQRKLVLHRVGVQGEGAPCRPTYVYPTQVKMLMRSVFPGDVCDYPDPCHAQVVHVTIEDLQKVDLH